MEIHLRDLARELTEAGHEIHIITSTPGPEEVDGIKVHRLNLKLFKSLSITRDAKTVPILEDLFTKENYDLIHGHGVASSLSHLALWIAKRWKIPSVMTSHSMLPELKFERILLTLIPFLLQFASTPTFRRLIRFKAVHPNLLTAVSSTAALEVSKIYNQKDVPILPNALDTTHWKYEANPKPPLRITSVMRLTSLKRAMELIKMIPRVNERLPYSHQPIFTIIGDGPLRPLMKEKIKELGIQDQVELMGYQPRDVIRDVFKQTRFFILPSRKEGFGIAILEARCFGLPVVAMKHGGVVDIISHGKDGLLCDSDEEFIRQIANVTLNKDLWSQLAKEASIPVTRFSWSHILPRYLNIYQSAMMMHPHLSPEMELELQNVA